MTEQDNIPITPEVKASLKRLYLVVRALRSLYQEMTSAQAKTFFNVAISERPHTVSGLAKVCGVNSTTITKHLGDLGTFKRNGAPGLRLIKGVRWPYEDRRLQRVVMTERGAMVARMLIEIFDGKRQDLSELAPIPRPNPRRRRQTRKAQGPKVVPVAPDGPVET